MTKKEDASCKAGEKFEKTIDIDIPTEDKIDSSSSESKIKGDARIMLKAFSTSVQGA